ncbi:MAG: hypothetical protein AAFV45_05035 [Pseudomonadota bacterium]
MTRPWVLRSGLVSKASLAAALVILVTPGVTVAETPDGVQASALLSDVADGSDLLIACQTTALAMNTSPFKSSQGTITIRVVLDGTEDGRRKGKWFVADIGTNHDQSFAVAARNSCKDGCTLRLASPPPKAANEAAAANQGASPRPGTPNPPATQLELWDPNPMGIDKLNPDQTLTIATFKLPSFDLKASKFEGRAPLIFEQGQCERIAALPAAKTETAPDTGAKPSEQSGANPDPQDKPDTTPKATAEPAKEAAKP